MTLQGFQRLALSMPEASEGSHMGHPDFRVRGKVFATLLLRCTPRDRLRCTQDGTAREEMRGLFRVPFRCVCRIRGNGTREGYWAGGSQPCRVLLRRPARWRFSSA